MFVSSVPSIPAKNRLLAALPLEEYELLLPNLETVSLPLKYVLYEPNKPIEHVYFPIHGVVSLVTIMEDGVAVEIATVGNEGMIGLPVFLGSEIIPMKAFSQIPGKGIRIKADVFKDLLNQGSSLHGLLQRYTQALFNQTAQSAACNRLHSIEERCCRWLLMIHDRVDSDEYLLTQEFLSQMLGVRRASVNVVASILQKARLIRYSRGRITILDRLGLETASCECYARIKQEFDRLLG
jgi:CRP-like cAMP-binding protein